MTSAPFPDGDDSLSRTLVFDFPGERADTQILVTLYSTGDVEVAQRPGQGATWGPPWSLREEEAW